MSNIKEETWISKRIIGLQPLVVFLIIAYLFSITKDPIPLLGSIKIYTGISESNSKLLINLILYSGLIFFWIFDNKKLFRKFIIIYTLFDIVLFFFIVYELINTIDFFRGDAGAVELMVDVITIWFINILLFGLFYWILDAGGPFKRIESDLKKNPELLFPQYTMNYSEFDKWKPDILDYITLSFTTATAFGPTDTFFLSKRFKVMMIIQVIFSLTILTVLATRAVSIIR